MSDTGSQPPGWYYAQGDPPGTQRYWDGSQWQGAPQPVGGAPAGGFGAPTAGYGTAQAQLASPWSRLLARIIDSLILIIPAIVVGAIVGGTAYYGSNPSFAFSGRAFVAGLLVTAIGLAYEFYFLSKEGATIGKKVMSVKVVKEDGSDLDQDAVIKRLILNAVGVIPILGGIISMLVSLATIIMIFVDDKRQVPWDKIAGTIVIEHKS